MLSLMVDTDTPRALATSAIVCQLASIDFACVVLDLFIRVLVFVVANALT